MSKINIYKIAYGSFANSLGDGTLYYSSNYSGRAAAINGFFHDTPPRLSKDYATAIWRYYADVDKYMLIHVQGSQVADASNARSYTYRAAFEVDRTELNGISQTWMPLSALFAAMPRIDVFTERKRVEAETELPTPARPAVSQQAKALAGLILTAILNRKRLCISIEASSEFKDNGVLDSNYFRTITEAIESLPVSIARYVSFSVCVDKNHEKVLDDVMVMAYVANSDFVVPADAVDTTWEKAVNSTNNVRMDVVERLATHLPGTGEALIPLADAMASLSDGYVKYDAIVGKAPEALTPEEWQTWLLAHNIKEVCVVAWPDMRKILNTMPAAIQASMIEKEREASLRWPLDAVMEGMMPKMNYSEAQLNTLRERAIGAYLYSDCKDYSFLFPQNVKFDFSAYLNADYLRQLSLKQKKDIDKWQRIFADRKCIDEKSKKAFVALYQNVPLNSLHSAVQLMSELHQKQLADITFDSLASAKEIAAIRYKDCSDLPLDINYPLAAAQVKWLEQYLKEVLTAYLQQYGNKTDNIEQLLSLVGDMRDGKKPRAELYFECIVAFLNDNYGNLKAKETWEFYAKNIWEKDSKTVLLPNLRLVVRYMFEQYIDDKSAKATKAYVDELCQTFKGCRDPRFSYLANFLMRAIRNNFKNDTQTDINEMEEKLSKVFKSLNKSNSQKRIKSMLIVAIAALVIGILIGGGIGYCAGKCNADNKVVPEDTIVDTITKPGPGDTLNINDTTGTIKK